MSKIETTIENITPQIAERMLLKNTNNRPINELNVLALSKEIKTGNWHLTGEAIKFDKEGALIDGQHRLMAIVKAERSAKMQVTRGLPSEAFKYIDTGRMRQASDVLAIEGFKNSVNTAAMIRFIIAYKRGNYNTTSTANRGAFRITNAMISEFASKYSKSVLDSYGFGYGKGNTKGKKLVNGTLAAGMHYILKSINEQEADDFFNKLLEGTMLTKTSPIHLLRERFMHDGLNKSKMNMSEKVALIIKAWNAYRKGIPVQRLIFVKGETFPKAA